jgi:hypothetical protein
MASTSSQRVQSRAEYPWPDDPVSEPSSPPPPIYSHIRNIRGVVGSLARPSSSQLQEAAAPSLGSHADEFLKAFGFQTSAKRQIFNAYKDSQTVDDFVDLLMDEGMAQTEAEWLWRIVNM